MSIYFQRLNFLLADVSDRSGLQGTSSRFLKDSSENTSSPSKKQFMKFSRPQNISAAACDSADADGKTFFQKNNNKPSVSVTACFIRSSSHSVRLIVCPVFPGSVFSLCVASVYSLRRRVKRVSICSEYSCLFPAFCCLYFVQDVTSDISKILK